MTIVQVNATSVAVGKLVTAPLRLGVGVFQFVVRTVARFYVGSFGFLLLFVVALILFGHIRIAAQWLSHLH